MKKQRLLLAALILSVSGWVSASVPIIKLHDSRKVEVNFYSLLALNSAFFGAKDNMKPVETSAGTGLNDLQTAAVSAKGLDVSPGLSKKVGNTSILTGQQVSEGSFSSYASGALTSASTIAPISDAGLPPNAERRYGLMVASVPAPKIWAVLLLAIGCVIYQGRRRRRPFGFETNRLNAGSVDA